MLSITPINNNYYNRNISFRARSPEPGFKSESPKNYSYDELYKLMRDLEITAIEEQEVIPPAKGTLDEQTSKNVGYTGLETLPYDDLGWTELHWLMYAMKENKAKEFIKQHPDFDINQRTKAETNFSYIALAVLNKCSENFVSELAANKALDLSKTNNDNWNDLHYLCCKGYIKAVKAVINNHPNLDFNQLTINGKSYIDIARENGRQDIVKLLEKLHR